MRISAALALLTVTLLPVPARAQRPLLDQADALITSGQFAEARAMLVRWRRENTSAARTNPEQQARFHLLSARVTADADSAAYNYLTVAVDYPTAPAAPEALLRLAQVRALRGDTAQAVAYLERLLSDYPDSDLRPMGAVWLARVKANGADAGVCSVLRAVNQGPNPETIEYLRAEQRRVCGQVSAAPRPAPVTTPPRTAQPRPAAQTPAPPPRAQDATAGRVTIQVGAFREFAGARGVQRQLENAGFNDVRLVRVPGNQLIRVRIGKFENRSAAAELLARLASANFSAVLVADAHVETQVTN